MEDAEAPLIAFGMFEIRQSRKTKRFRSLGSWFWHILFLLEDFRWMVTQSFFPSCPQRSASLVLNVLVHAAIKRPRQ